MSIDNLTVLSIRSIVYLLFLFLRGRDTAQILRIRDRARALYIHTDVCPIIFVPGVTIEVKNILERMSDDVSVEDDKSIQ